MSTLIQFSKKLVRAGLSVIPVRADGSKGPAINSWKPLQTAIADCRQLKEWFSRKVGIAVITGKVSGNLEVLDFDDAVAFDLWLDTAIGLLG